MQSLGFRKFGKNKQGLKILIYGENNTGKSALVLGLKRNIVIDTESKIGSYENDKNYSKNNLGVLSTNDYKKCLKTLKTLIHSKELDDISTIILDSETKLFNNLSVSMLEIEEKRAEMKAIRKVEKTGKSVDTQFLIDDALVSQRGYGKIKLKAETLSSVRAILSEKGKIWVSVSHLKDLKEKVGDQMIKVGDAPDVYKSSPYDFDIILKTSREKDLISGSYKYFVEVEKDTYGIVSNGKKIDITSENFSKGNIITKSINNFIEDEEKSDKEVGNNFDELDDSITDGMSESEETKILAYDTYMEEFKKIYISLDKEKQSLAKDIINKYASDGKVTSIKKISDLEKVVTELKEL